MRVALLGLGTMGLPMARNLLRAGHLLTVWNRTPGREASLVAEGAAAAGSPAAAVRGAEAVLLMLRDPAAVHAVLDGEMGVLAGLGPEALVVDMSTVDPECARLADKKVRAAGGRFVDAPVSGSRRPAEEGRLLIMAGGEAADVERVRPVLAAIGRVVAVGGVGQGMAMKLVLNGLGAHMMTGFAAMLVLGSRLGLDARTMLEVIGGGAFASPLYVAKGPRMVAHEFAPDFTLALMHKDQELVLKTAATLGYPMPTLAAVRDVLARAIAHGLGGDDLCGVVQLFESWAQVRLAN